MTNINMKTNRITIAPIILLVIIILSSVSTFSASSNNNFFIYSGVDAQENGSDDNDTSQSLPYVGPNMKGFYTSANTRKDIEGHMPANYYEDSFRLIHDAGMNHVRFIFYWEAYEKNPSLFLQELDTVAQSAEKYGIKVIYDNHNYQTSSWLESIANGFPLTLFESNPDRYPYDSGGSIKYETAKIWWTDWWDRSVKDTNGNDGWTLLADFLKKIIHALDNYESTLGYEILSEPQVHSKDQWEKIGQFNTFMVDELRKITQKTIAYSWTVPFELHTPIDVNPENIAKMTPANKNNVVFKISLYGMPEESVFQQNKLETFIEASQIAGVPLYIGEWNNVRRELTTTDDGMTIYKTNPESSDISQEETTLLVDMFNDLDVFGWAYWKWDLKEDKVASFNLITVVEADGTEEDATEADETEVDGTEEDATEEDGIMQPTKYFEQLKNAISTVYGSSNIIT